jgi:hypothetical protein
MQNGKLEAKVAAIKEYNRVKKRVDEKPEVNIGISLTDLFNKAAAKKNDDTK